VIYDCKETTTTEEAVFVARSTNRKDIMKESTTRANTSERN